MTFITTNFITFNNDSEHGKKIEDNKQADAAPLRHRAGYGEYGHAVVQ